MRLIDSVVLSLFAVFSFSTASGIVLPVSEDTSASPRGTLTSATGNGGALGVSPGRSAFLRFDVGTLAPSLSAGDVSRARLILYFPRVIRSGELSLHAVSAEWKELAGRGTPQPSFGPAISANIPAGAVLSKQFVLVDVTTQVKNWLGTPQSDFGLAVVSEGAASVLIGAKEGPGSGYPAVLEIETSATVTNSDLASGIDAAKVGSGNVSNAEFAYLGGVTAPLQSQIGSLTLELSEVGAEMGELGVSLSTKVSRAGDVMTGALSLPLDGLAVGSDQLVTSGGSVGIGTATPGAKLDVRGDVRFGPLGNQYALGGEENLRIVRGTILYQNGTLSVVAGRGFRVAAPVSGRYTVTFDPPFSAPPTISVNLETPAAITTVALASVSASSCTVIGGTTVAGSSIHLIAIGPR